MEEYEIYEEKAKSAFVEHLLQNDYLSDSTEIGVAKQYVDRGLSSLSDKQKHVIEGILREHAVVCEECEELIPWDEQIHALNDPICGECEYRRNRILEDD
ncbi:MAG: hypothetical protein AB1941_06475 [Gemmatimonadota bacterium]